MKYVASRKLMVILALFLGLGTFLTACHTPFIGIKGEGPVETVTLDIADFTGVDLQGAFNVEIVNGTDQLVVATGHQNIIDRIEKDVVNGVWEMKLKKGTYRDYDLTIKITSPKINTMIISGSGNIESEGFDNLTTLTTVISGSGNIAGSTLFKASQKVNSEISGSGNVTLITETPSFESVISGSGSMYLSGTANAENIVISGSGDHYGFGMESENVDVTISGSGNVEVKANNTLDVTVSGSGNIYYKGTPQVTTNISGSGNVYNAN